MLKKANVRYRRAYNLRHGFASSALTAGTEPTFLVPHLGHSLEMTPNVYGKFINSDLDGIELEKLEKIKVCPELCPEGGKVF